MEMSGGSQRPRGTLCIPEGSRRRNTTHLRNTIRPKRPPSHIHRPDFRQPTEFTEGQLILEGDFNVPLIPSSDTLLGRSVISPSQRKEIINSLHKAQLIHIWRLQHSGERDYTFYSSLHKLYSRIDFFLIPHNYTPCPALRSAILLGRTMPPSPFHTPSTGDP